MKKVVVAMDSMKGCLDSLSASQALAKGIKVTSKCVDVVCVPVADGGEGTSIALSYCNDRYRRMNSKVLGPLGAEIEAEWYLDEKEGTAFIDMASAAGLALLDENCRNPLKTTSYGVGQLIMDAAMYGARKILLGLGGSATVDAGLGACQAMGLVLLDENGFELATPFYGGMLDRVNGFQISGWLRENKSVRIDLLCDVTAQFTGADGAARVFGPQKGATPEDVEFLESGMENVRKMMTSKLDFDPNEVTGTGAAGGMAGGIMAFAGAMIKSGAPTLLDVIGFDRMIEGADLIVTGEGSSDRQTLMGKLPFEILQRGKRMGIPVLLVAGMIEDENLLLQAGFDRIICINSPEIVERSGTVGKNPMEPAVAVRRLEASMEADD